MKTDIYYFSGSGNSFNIAKTLGKKLEQSSIISIPKVINRSDAITGDVIGIVCPVYFHNVPHIVVDFIGKIKKVKYMFMVCAGAGEPGGALRKTKKMFAAHNIQLSSLFTVTMPDNSTRYGAISKETQTGIFDRADLKIEEIVKTVRRQEECCDHTATGFFETYIYPGMLFRFLYAGMKNMDSGFTTNDNCNGCGICRKVCPVSNITMKDTKPVWNKNGRCQVCCACHDWCPKEAVLHSSTKAGVRRYHHPAVTINDMIGASAQECEDINENCSNG